MAEITYDKFDLGLDLRKGPSVSDANRLRVLQNAYVNTGHTLTKRPAAVKVATLEAGTKGLRPALGVLNTFYENGTIVHANPLFVANKVPHPTLSQSVVRAHFCLPFLGFLYAVVEYADGSVWHHYLDGTSPTRITDPNCPQTKAVSLSASKIWAAGAGEGSTVRFSAAGNPRNWTGVTDAGFISPGIQQDGSQVVTALGQYQNKLGIFFKDGAQMWTVDQNPTNNALFQRIYGVGCPFPRTPAAFSTDIFFASAMGVRSLTIAAFTSNMQDVDVGSPIDTLVVPTLTGTPIGAYVPGLGQYWLAVGTTIWVFTFSRTSKISAWSQYIFPFTVDDFAPLNQFLYLRSGDAVYRLDPTQFTDDGVTVSVLIEMPYLDLKLGGHMKQIYAVDAVVQGTCTLALRFDPRDPTKITDTVTLSSDTRPGPIIPLEVMAEEVAPVFTHAAGEAFKLDWLKIYYNDLGISGGP